jgi:hypothetical protein
MPTWQDVKAAQRFAQRDTFDRKWIEEKSKLVLDSCHPKQRQFVLDTHRRISVLCGRRAGKTTGFRARAILKMLRIPRARLLYVAETRGHAESLMWNGIKGTLEAIGVEATFNETKLRCTLARNGSQIELIGASDTAEIDKQRGKKFHEVGIDEAASFPRARLENLLQRVIGPALGDYRGVLCLFGTPGHILAGPFYDATRPGSDEHRRYEDRDLDEYDGWKGWSSHSWNVQDGAPFIEEMANTWDEALTEKAANGWSDDNPIWLREWCGKWAADNTENVFKYRPHLEDGTPWNQWDPPRIGPLGFAQLPDTFNDWCHVISMDEGHSDPFACNVFAFSPSDTERNIYHRFSFEKTHLYEQKIAQLLIGEDLNHEHPPSTSVIGNTGWPDAMVADMGDGPLAELQNVYGIRITPVQKGFKYKFPAVEVVNGDLIDGRLHILKGSPLEQQMMELQWVANEFGVLSENKAQANHSTDTLIYGRAAIGTLISAGNLTTDKPKPRNRWDEPPDEVETPGDILSEALEDASYEAWGND